jgi:hypothetical protein
MNWIILSDVTYLPNAPSDRHRFRDVEPPKREAAWHNRSKSTAGVSEWRGAWDHVAAAWAEERLGSGFITTFPQRAVAAGLRKRLSRSRAPIVAYSFNLGRLYGGAKGVLARIALASVDRFVVHSRRERDGYAAWLKLPVDRFRFIPLHGVDIPKGAAEDTQRPFLVSMGSAGRDYRILFEVVRRLDIPTIVVASPHAVAGLDVPACVELRSGLTPPQCWELTQRARVAVVPVANSETASGQITVVDAMRMGKPLVATRCMGTEDYITSGENGLLVAHGQADALEQAIASLWQDRGLRERLGSNARGHAERTFTNEAAGRALNQILDELEDSRLGPVRAGSR